MTNFEKCFIEDADLNEASIESYALFECIKLYAKRTGEPNCNHIHDCEECRKLSIEWLCKEYEED